MSKNRISKILKKQWVSIWLIIASLMLAAVIAYASYQDSDTMLKRVVAPSADLGGLFSSNYLGQGPATDNQRSAPFSANESKIYIYDLTVRNYNQADPSKTYKGTITYDLSVSLVHSDSDATKYNYNNNTDKHILDAMKADEDLGRPAQTITVSVDSHTLTFGWNGETLCDITQEIRGLTLSEASGVDTVRVTYTNIDLNSDFCLMFTADPTDSNPDLYELSGVISVSTSPDVHGDGWKCVLNDAVSDTPGDAHSYDNYDAFNYLITGTGNKILKFSYNSNYVFVNPTFCGFITEATESAGTDGWKTITINAKPNADDDDPNKTSASRYDIQVYKKTDADGAEWKAATLQPNASGAYIRFEDTDYAAS